MELDTIISIKEVGTVDTYDIHHEEKQDFFINEPNYICEGVIVHNSGIIISDTDLDEKIPIVRGKDQEYISGFQESGSCTDLLAAGFIKFDILGVNNLDIVRDVINEIKKQENRDFDIHNVPENEEKVFDILKRDTEGLFQISSPLMKNLIETTKPQNMNELCDLIALGRPGPLGVGSDKEYIHNKENPPTNIPKFISDALESTHFVLLYQEQVMKIFMNLGFSEQEADEIRGLLKKIQKLKIGKISSEEKKRLKELDLLK
jgi:DNA polymerase III subunit alpha